MNLKHQELKIFALAVVVALGVFFIGCNGENASSPYKKSRLDTDNKVVTPAGATVFVKNGAVATRSLIEEIDKGLARLQVVGQFLEYTKKITPSEYWVELVARNPKCINPAYTLQYRGSAYDNSEYDKNPEPGVVELCIAGQYHGVYGMDPLTAPAWISVVADLDTTATVTYYEGEHAAANFNDQALYDRTKYHGSGSGHPILPQPPSFVSGSDFFKGAGNFGGAGAGGAIDLGILRINGERVTVLITK
jgi:hypothetical protein